MLLTGLGLAERNATLGPAAGSKPSRRPGWTTLGGAGRVAKGPFGG